MAIRHPHLPKVPTLYYPVSPATVRQEVEYLALGFPQAEIIPLLGPSQQHWLEEKKAPALANQFTLAANIGWKKKKHQHWPINLRWQQLGQGR